MEAGPDRRRHTRPTQINYVNEVWAADADRERLSYKTYRSPPQRELLPLSKLRFPFNRPTINPRAIISRHDSHNLLNGSTWLKKEPQIRIKMKRNRGMVEIRLKIYMQLYAAYRTPDECYAQLPYEFNFTFIYPNRTLGA